MLQVVTKAESTKQIEDLHVRIEAVKREIKAGVAGYPEVPPEHQPQ